MPCVEFSAMGFSSVASQDASVSASSTTTSSSLLSGWGSAVSRKSYACLKTLGETEARKMQRYPRTIASRQISRVEPMGDTWGYFVDTPDN